MRPTEPGAPWRYVRGDGRTVPFVVRIGGDVAAATRCYFLRFEPQQDREDETTGSYVADTATGLPRWRELRERLEEHVEKAAPLRKHLAVFLVELSNLDTINQSVGHTAGSLAARLSAHRLAAVLGGRGVLARASDNTFGIVLPLSGPVTEARRVAHLMQETVRTPCVIAERDIVLGVRMGIALFPKDGQDADTLLRSADNALSAARDGGGGSRPLLRTGDAPGRLPGARSWPSPSGAPLARGELALRYQPQVDATTGHVIAAEALLRWFHPQWGPVSPAEFIPVAEETGAIVEIGEWVIAEACWTLADWWRDGVRLDRVARQRVHAAVRGAAARRVGPPRPEGRASAAQQPRAGDHGELRACVTSRPDSGRCRRCARWGVAVAIDDFGVGYSSLRQIAKLPADTLKIDRSFVSQLARSDDDRAVVRTILDLARKMRLRAVVEGVETQEQYDIVHQMGAAVVQGFHFARPMTAAEVGHCYRSRL